MINVTLVEADLESLQTYNMRAKTIIHCAGAFFLIVSIAGANSFCTDFSVLPHISCDIIPYQGIPFGCVINEYYAGNVSSMSYRISPGVICSTTAGGCDCPISTVGGIEISQSRMASVTLDEEEEEQLYLMA